MDAKQIRQLSKLNADLKAINRVLDFGAMALDPDTIADLIRLKEMIRRRLQDQAAAGRGERVR